MCPPVLLATLLVYERGVGSTLQYLLGSILLRDSRSALESGVLEIFITCR